MLRPGVVGMRGSMVIPQRPCMISSTYLLSGSPGLFRGSPRVLSTPWWCIVLDTPRPPVYMRAHRSSLLAHSCSFPDIGARCIAFPDQECLGYTGASCSLLLIHSVRHQSIKKTLSRYAGHPLSRRGRLVDYSGDDQKLVAIGPKVVDLTIGLSIRPLPCFPEKNVDLPACTTG